MELFVTSSKYYHLISLRLIRLNGVEKEMELDLRFLKLFYRDIYGIWSNANLLKHGVFLRKIAF